MIDRLLTSVFGSRFQREQKRIRPIVTAIHAAEARLKDLPDPEIQAQTARFRARISERTAGLREEVDRLKAAKHACPDPTERLALDEQLGKAEDAFRKALAASLEEILPEAFATVREATRRLTGSTVLVTGHPQRWDMVPYDVQLIGGIVLHQGKIAEMATGEGKTLVATLPVYLNALTGRGVHVVTVNNYLARRDSQWMGHLYGWLGLTIGCLDDTEPGTLERRAAYMADITYGTNNEFGFDYLRDNMVFHLDQRVQREHVYAIIDEVDSILVDEARTPLIISGPVGHEENDAYGQFNRQVLELVRRQSAVTSELVAEGEALLQDPKRQREAGMKLFQAQMGTPKNKRLAKLLNETGVKQLVQKAELESIADKKLPARQRMMGDIEESLFFVLDEKGHAVHLTDQGAAALSPGEPTLFVVPDISEAFLAIEKDPDLTPAQRVEQRLALESDYARKNEKLSIIHKLLQAHALYEREVDYLVQDGLVVIVDEFTGRTMPGRRWADGLHQAVEAKEGVQVKGETQTLATVTIQNYFRMYEKLSGMTGTAETEETEFFQIYGLDVMVIPTNRPVRRLDEQDQIYRTRREKYNALMDEVERLHTKGLPVLIGTVNVDVSETLSRQLKRRGLKHEVLNAKYHQREAEIVASAGARGAITIATNMAGRGTDIKLGDDVEKQADGAGLQIIGTERHESRRIDRQLRGRSGRQGDPGRSAFFLSLEDDLMRLFGTDRIAAWMDKSGAEEGEVITGKLVTGAIGQAQKRVEMQNFQARKQLIEYDDVMNQQREVIYSQRLFALERGEELRGEGLRMVEDAVTRFATDWLGTGEPELWDRAGLKQALLRLYLIQVDTIEDPATARDLDEILELVRTAGREAYQRKLGYLADFGKQHGVEDVPGQLLSQVALTVLDEKWKDHLYDLDNLRAAIRYRAYGQKDPLVEYKHEAYEMFGDLIGDIHKTFTERFLMLQVSANPQAPPRRPPPVATPAPRTTGSDDLFGPPARGGSADRAALPAGASLGAPAAAAVATVGRNDPCPCGSGKKYKKCHGAVT
ncbi:MAG: preprotein translocase subunit SecA [Gemmatimonadales bacterium]